MISTRSPRPAAGRSRRRGTAMTVQLTVVAMASLTLAACGGGGSDSGSSNGPIVVGSILDKTGGFSGYGVGKDRAAQLAISQINEDGGLLGRKVELKSYDTQSDLDKYTTYANELALKVKPAVVVAGITSAAKEAIRPIFDRSKTLYFYAQQYEGGACGKNLFTTGTGPSQQLQAFIPSQMEKLGKKVYIAAADYNFGQITASWVQQYVKDAGGEVVKTDFVPVESSDFGSVISDIQREKPDFVFSALVGDSHLAFYRAYAAAGLNKTAPIVSSTFGLAGEQRVLTPAQSEGITVAYPYFRELDTPENKAFLEAWAAKFGDAEGITDSDVTTYNAWMLWAEGVKKAKSIEHDDVVKALESGISFNSPEGKVTMDPGSHSLIQPVSIARANAEGGFEIVETADAVAPTFEQEKCDLVKDPSTNTSFVPKS